MGSSLVRFNLPPVRSQFYYGVGAATGRRFVFELRGGRVVFPLFVLLPVFAGVAARFAFTFGVTRFALPLRFRFAPAFALALSLAFLFAGFLRGVGVALADELVLVFSFLFSVEVFAFVSAGAVASPFAVG
jgi:hypothetical protein